MAKTPLRALRVSDELWRAAQARARDCEETVSEVVRRALTVYVEESDDGTPLATSTLHSDSSFLLAQGMMMQRYGLDADEAAAYLHRLSEDRGLAVEEVVRTLLERRGSDQLEATSLG